MLTLLNDVNSITSNLVNNYDSTIKNPINNSKGCGGVMRVAPIGLMYNKKEAFRLGCDCAALTHGHPSGYISGGMLSCIISCITIALANEKIPEAKAILNDFIDAISKINNSEDTKDLINFLKNDVMTNVDFLKSPVDIVQKTIYPMTNYGASMTPFYTTLCLWVGILLLTSLLTTEVHVKGEDDDQYKPYQVYLGRGLINSTYTGIDCKSWKYLYT